MKTYRLLRWIAVMNTLLIIQVCRAQEPSEPLLEEVWEEMAVHNDEDNLVHNPNGEEELEELDELRQQPVNLNCATKEQLERFPFLTDLQIEHLLAYVYLHGPMKTVYELQLVKDMDRTTLRRLLPFVCVEAINNPAPFQWKNLLKNAVKYGKHELSTRFDIPFYKREGYEHTYLGPAVYNAAKYAFRHGNQVYAGLTAEKDAGEPFGALHDRRGYDYYSFYFLLRDCGRLKSLALGNYRLSFGQGLVISTDYLMGKTAYASALTPRSSGIRKHSSNDEYNYFRGAAIAVSVAKGWEVSAFYSHRNMDGTVTDGTVTSIDKTGWHRSQKEADKRNQFTLQLAGGNIRYQQGVIQLGITGIYYVFNRSYQPLLTGYAKYNLHGNRFYNVGMNYAYRFRRFYLQGETAIGKQGWATLNRLQYVPTQSTRLLLVHRYYSYHYWAMFARSFGEGSTVQNEQGYYLGVETAPFARWRLFASIDLFSFPWKKYRISKASSGKDGLLQVTFTPTDPISMYLTYRYKQKERDLTGTQGKVTLPTYHHRLRYRLHYTTSSVFGFRTTADYNRFRSQGQVATQGWQVSQMLSVRVPSLRLTADAQGTYFDTDDYDSRVYAYEPGLLYTMYTPSFYGCGFRGSVRLRYEPNAHWLFIAKFGETVYLDRTEIGSGHDLIAGNKKADLQLQLRIKF